MLYLVATPIGNLADITFRAIEILKSVDLILCEDTRHSLALLRHYDIHKPLKSLHKFNEAAQQEEILEQLKAGQKIALISDAGTPGISDPGSRLVKACTEQQLSVTAIPGACAAITALSCSGLDTDRFQFFGFLPRKKGALRTTLIEILTYPGTTICYESPHRLKETLELFHQLDPHRPLAIGRELTKKFEETKKGTALELLSYWSDHVLKGEIVLMISGQSFSSMPQLWETLSIEEHVHSIIDAEQVSKNVAIKKVAELRGIPKREVYNKIHQ